MKHYTPKQINQIKQEIRTGKPVAIIADELAKEWKRPVAGVYSKVLRLSKMTRKIVNTYEGPTKRPYVRKKAPRPAVIQEAVTMDFQPMPGSLWDNFDKRVEEITADIEVSKIPVVQEICEEILEKPIERQPAEIGIEVPASIISFTDTPKKVVIYSDHIRYYFNN
jgi:hypothetical protein